MSRRRRALDDYEEEHLPDLPSTTRAVAWTAMIFSTLALLVALATLFLTWRDGVLAQNVAMLSGELSRHWRGAANRATTQTQTLAHSPRTTRPASPGAFDSTTPVPISPRVREALPIGTNPTELSRLEEIRSRLTELESKILRGDKNATLNLEQLRRELEGLRSFASQATNDWINPAIGKLREARTLLQENGPQAAALMKMLATDLKGRMQSGPASRPGSAPNDRAATNLDDSALPQPEAEAPDSAPLERPAYRAADQSGDAAHSTPAPE